MAAPSASPPDHVRSAVPALVRLVDGPFDPAEAAAPLASGAADVGAVVTFAGYCRSEGGTLAALELEHYPGMAEAEIGRIVDQAQARWPLSGVTVVHRYGLVKPGEAIVLVATASAHRGAAFAAAEFLMDYLKAHAPFWKKEHRADGTSGRWVPATLGDAEAARRWSDPTST